MSNPASSRTSHRISLWSEGRKPPSIPPLRPQDCLSDLIAHTLPFSPCSPFRLCLHPHIVRSTGKHSDINNRGLRALARNLRTERHTHKIVCKDGKAQRLQPEKEPPRQPMERGCSCPSLPLSTEYSIYIQGSVIYCRNSASEIHLMIKHNLWYFLLNSKLSRPENAIAPPELNTFSPSELNTSKFVSNVTKCVRLTPLIPSASDAIVSNPHNKSPLFSMQNETDRKSVV